MSVKAIWYYCEAEELSPLSFTLQWEQFSNSVTCNLKFYVQFVRVALKIMT